MQVLFVFFSIFKGFCFENNLYDVESVGVSDGRSHANDRINSRLPYRSIAVLCYGEIFALTKETIFDRININNEM